MYIHMFQQRAMWGYCFSSPCWRKEHCVFLICYMLLGISRFLPLPPDVLRDLLSSEFWVLLRGTVTQHRWRDNTLWRQLLLKKHQIFSTFITRDDAIQSFYYEQSVTVQDFESRWDFTMLEGCYPFWWFCENQIQGGFSFISFSHLVCRRLIA